MITANNGRIINGIEFCDVCGLVRGEYRRFDLVFCQDCWNDYLEKIAYEMSNLGISNMEEEIE